MVAEDPTSLTNALMCIQLKNTSLITHVIIVGHTRYFRCMVCQHLSYNYFYTFKDLLSPSESDVFEFLTKYPPPDLCRLVES